jgi:hypothetical protein
MQVFTTRFANLDRLIDEAGSLDELARRLNWKPQELRKYARREFTVSGDVSRLLEHVMSKPHGWMSCSHSAMCGHLIEATRVTTKGSTQGVTKRATRGGTVSS